MEHLPRDETSITSSNCLFSRSLRPAASVIESAGYTNYECPETSLREAKRDISWLKERVLQEGDP
jgi:hypothetical protein